MDPFTGCGVSVHLVYRHGIQGYGYGAADALGNLGNRFEVQTDVPVYSVAPGQACVCYDGERLLGGGWID